MGKPLWQLRPEERWAKQDEDRKKAIGDRKYLVQKLNVKTPDKPKKEQKPKPEKVIQAESVSTIADESKVFTPRELVTVAGDKPIAFYSRSSVESEFHLQPWAKDITAIILDAVVNGGVHICLVWPAAFDSIVPLHGLANIEKIFEGDMNGFRTLLYPGNHNSRSALQGILVDRTRISELYKLLWEQGENGSFQFKAPTRSKSFEAVLSALNNIRNYHDSEVEDPSLGELFPVFIFDPDTHSWLTATHSPLERSLVKVDNLAFRKDIRKDVNSEWSDPVRSPGSLMVIHNSAKKSVWKEALSNKAVNDFGKPELLLLDATGTAERANFNAVQKIPDFLKYAIDHGYEKTGAVIITDDPKTYFTMCARLHTLKILAKAHIWAAEGEQALLSSSPVRYGWKPMPRSNAHFSVSIVDRDASQIALNFQRAAQEIVDEQSIGFKTLMNACLYLLRLSNLPAGYVDLTEFNNSEEDNDYMRQMNAWGPIESGIMTALAGGELNSRRSEILSAIEKAKKLIDTWGDATPMAVRLLEDVKKYTAPGRSGVSIVLPSRKYIRLAIRYIERKLGDVWFDIQDKVSWHTLSSIRTSLDGNIGLKHLTFVGLNNHVLRILLTEKNLPFDTSVLIAYKQADSALQTLQSMKRVTALESYYGRMTNLYEEIERRLAEVPNPFQIGKLGELKMTFNLEDPERREGEYDIDAYKFMLEGGEVIYAAGYVYKYVPDQDPFFDRVFAKSIKPSDLIFDMSDELKDKIESALYKDENGVDATLYPERALLRLYHEDVRVRCNLFFSGIEKRSKLALAIYNKMILIDPAARNCNPSNVYYWLDIQNKSDTRPHAPKSAKFFKIFCKTLEMSDEQAVQNWNFIKNARRLSINLGRELSMRYAEILFRPGSAMINRKVPDSVIRQLRQDTLLCIYRVDQVAPPKKGSNPSHQNPGDEQ